MSGEESQASPERLEFNDLMRQLAAIREGRTQGLVDRLGWSQKKDDAATREDNQLQPGDGEQR